MRKMARKPRSLAITTWNNTSNLFRLGSHSQIGLNRLPAFWELGLGVLVGDGRHDDDVLALLPIHWSRHRLPCRKLHRIQYPQYFVEVSPRGHRVDEHQLNLFVRPDDKHRSDGCVIGCGSAL